MQKWDNDKFGCEFKNLRKLYVRGKDYIWSSSTCTCENGKHLKCVIGDLVVTCDGIIEVKITAPKKTSSAKTIFGKSIPIRTIPTNFNEKK